MQKGQPTGLPFFILEREKSLELSTATLVLNLGKVALYQLSYSR